VAVAFGARIADDLAGAVTGAARPADRQETLLVEDFAAAVVGGAVAGSAAGFAAGPLAAFAAPMRGTGFRRSCRTWRPRN
jgi:hypothetical protein